MTTDDDRNVRTLRTELARLIARHGVELSDERIVEVLREHIETLQQDSADRPAPTGEGESSLQEESAILIDEPQAPDESHLHQTDEVAEDPPTVRFDVNPEEVERAMIPEAAMLKRPERPREVTPASSQPTVDVAEHVGKRAGQNENTVGYDDLESEGPATREFDQMAIVELFNEVREHHGGSYVAPREEAAARFRGACLARTFNPLLDASHLPLGLHERPLVDRVLREPTPFEDVLNRSPLPRTDTIAILAGLEAVGLLGVEDRPASVELGDEASEEIDGQEAATRIDVLHKRLERDSHFELLGLHWTTHTAQIEERYRVVHRNLEALDRPALLEVTAAERLETITKRFAKAWKILGDPDKRRAYRHRIISSDERNQTAQKLEALADAALRRKSFVDALDFYRRLREIDPDDARANRLITRLEGRTGRS